MIKRVLILGLGIEFNTSDLLNKYQHDYYVKKLDINFLRNKLDYMTDSEKMLLKKNDF